MSIAKQFGAEVVKVGFIFNLGCLGVNGNHVCSSCYVLQLRKLGILE